jgi:hypothetical protein
MCGDALQNVCEPDEGIDAKQFAGSHQGVKYGNSIGCFVAACEQINFSSNSYQPYVFHAVFFVLR